MPVVIDDRTLEVCRMVSIGPNTLFRCLKEGVFSDVERSHRRGWRVFTAAQVAAIRTRSDHVFAISQSN
jgi:hypothetical protein